MTIIVIICSVSDRVKPEMICKYLHEYLPILTARRVKLGTKYGQ